MAFFTSIAERAPDGSYHLRAGGITIPDRAYNTGDEIQVTITGGTFATPQGQTVTLRFVGREEGTSNPVFDTPDAFARLPGLQPRRFILTNEPPPATGTAPYGAGDIVEGGPFVPFDLPGYSRFGSVGNRGDGDDAFDALGGFVGIPDRAYAKDDPVTIIHVSGDGTRTEIAATFAGHESGTGHPIFDYEEFEIAGTTFRDGSLIAIDGPASYPYAPGTVVEDVPYRIGDATFSNYGFRQGDPPAGDFALQGTGPLSGLDVPAGVYEAGDTLTIQPFGGAGAGPAVTVTYIGRVAGPGGRAYPVFEAADFKGGGRTQFIGTGEAGTGPYAAGEIDDAAYWTGVATFADYGLRVGETGDHESRGGEIEFDQGIHQVGDEVELRVVESRDSNGIPTFGHTFKARLAGLDARTGDPVFNPPASPPAGFPGGRQIIAASTGQATYAVNIVDKAWPPGTDGATFANYGFRQGDLDADFALQGGGPLSGLDVPAGVYRAGDTLTIQPLGGAGAGPAVEVTYLGRAAGPGGEIRPLFEAADFNGGGRAQFLGTEVAGTGAHDPGAVVAGVPLETGVAAFADYGLRVGTSNFFDSRGRGIEFDQKVYGAGDRVELRIAGRDGPVQATFAGYDRRTGNLFLDPTDGFGGGQRIIIAAGARQPGGYTANQANFAAGAWPRGIDDVAYTNYGFRRDFDGDFDLQGTGAGLGLEVPAGLYRAGDTLEIRPFGGAAAGPAVTVTYKGHFTGPGGELRPVFEAADFNGGGRAQFLGTSQAGTGAYAPPGGLVAGEPLGIGFAEFADYGVRRGSGDGGDFPIQTPRGLKLEYGAYEPGDEVMLLDLDGGNPRAATLVGFERGTGHPVFQIEESSAGVRTWVIAYNGGSGTSYTLDPEDLAREAWPPELSFANYGFRQGTDGAFDLQGAGAGLGLEIPDGVYRNGDTLVIEPFGGVAAGPAVTVTYKGHFAGPGGEIRPVFEAADYDGGGIAQFIGTDAEGTGSYAPAAAIVDNAPYRVGDAASPGHTAFANYGFRQGENLESIDFDLQGTGRNSGIEIPDGVYRNGNTLVIQPFGGEAAGPAVTVTLVGHVDGPNGEAYPIFETDDFRGSGQRAQFIGTSEPDGTATYRPGMIDEDEPVGIGVVVYSNYGTAAAGTNAFANADDAIGIPDGVYRPGTEVELTIGGAARTARFAGYEKDTSYPIFDVADFDGSGTPMRLIATNEPAGDETYTVDPDDIVDDALLGVGVPTPGADATFADYGLRDGAGDDYDSRGREVDIEHGVYGAGDAVRLWIIESRGSDGSVVVERTFEATFVGYDRDTGNPVFDPPADVLGGRRLVAANAKEATYEIADSDIVGGERLGIGVPSPGPFHAFADFGLRRPMGDTDEFTSQVREIRIERGSYEVGDDVEVQVIADSGAVGQSFVAKFAGYDPDTGNPLLDPPQDRFSGRQIVASATREAIYDVPVADIVDDMPLGIGVPPSSAGFVTFRNYGLRDGTGDDYAPSFRQIQIERGVHRAGDDVDLRIISEQGAIQRIEDTFAARFVGYDRGTGMPLFEPPPSFEGGRQIVVARETDTPTYEVARSDIVADTPLGIGVPTPGTFATFADYGLRDGAGGDYDSRGREVDIDHGVYLAGDRVEIRIIASRGSDGRGVVERSFEAEFVGYDRDTGDPVFDPPADVLGGRRLVAAKAGAETYAIADGDIVTDMPLELGFSWFPEYGLRVPGEDIYNTQRRAVEVEHGVHEVGDIVSIRIVLRLNDIGNRYVEHTLEARFVGYDRDTGNPLFDPPSNFRSGRQIVASATRDDEITQYEVARSDIVTDTPYKIGDVTFSNFGIGPNQDGTGAYTLDGSEITFAHGVYRANDEVTLTAGTRTWTGRFVGLETSTGNPIFRIPASQGQQAFSLIATNEPGTGSHTVPAGGVTTDVAYETDEPYEPDEPDQPDPPLMPPSGDAQFSLYFNLNNANGGYVFSRSFGGETRPNQTVSYRDDAGNFIWTAGSSTTSLDIPFAGDTTATFIGYEKDTFFPIFEASALNGTVRIIGVNGVFDNSYVVNPADLVTDMPYVTCFAPGTLIATPYGECAVETLKPGDVVLTAHDGVATVKWVGFQKVPTMFGPPELTQPVRIMAGALDDNVPHTDLVVTKDHGMIVDGVICQAGALINGTSIVEVPTRELDRDQHGLATYYHVETWNHVPLLANGAAAESFIDNVDRSVFGNHSEFVALYGSYVPAMTEMTLPRAMSARQVPKRISSRLATRADMSLGSVARKA